jgi:hypothetical protein
MSKKVVKWEKSKLLACKVAAYAAQPKNNQKTMWINL